MCDRAALLALAVALLAGPARAQDQAVLRARIARLERDLRSAEAAAAAARADSVAHLIDARLDTVRMGALRVLAPAGLGPEAPAASAAAASLTHTAFGTAAAALAQRPFMLVLMAARREARPVPVGSTA